jgi:wobble nucleotide-excising tRNase
MIESIAIKNVATYDSMGVEIRNLKKINFIYGANGSGKTTITNFIESADAEQFGECKLIWKNGLTLKVVTYNKNFRDNNFGKGKIDGVFTLGNATKEQLELIAAKQVKLAEIKEKGLQKKTTIENQIKTKAELEGQFQESCWVGIYKKFDIVFNTAFEGAKSKERFKTRLLSECQSNKQALKNVDELKAKAKTIFGEAPVSMSEFGTINYEILLNIEQNNIWGKKVIGKSDIEIAKLIQRLNLNDWVNQGRQFIEMESKVCPFCQKETIDKGFKDQLEEYFDETFTADTKLIKELSEQYVSEYQNLYYQLQGIENSESSNKNTTLNLSLFSAYLKTLNQQFASNKELLNNKLKEPSRSLELVSMEDQLISIEKLLSEANVKIKTHNRIVANFQTEKANLIADIWKYLIDDNKSNIDAFIKQVEGLLKGINKLETERGTLLEEYKNLEKEVKEASKHVTSIQPSVNAINDTLMAYGFDNFKIVASKTVPNAYQIEREDGSIAEKTLSEGEVTFITFLYYLQLAKGSISEDSISDDRILVIDDPISSLDSTVLFVVSSLIKEVIKNIKKNVGSIKQLILFTHNVYFHKEVSFVDRSDNNRDDVHHWILRKNGNVSNIQCFEKKNPIRSSYELLWDELKNQDKLSGITLQNTMRRILETYFKTMGKYTDDSLINSFDNKHEKEICRSLICWVNDGSHCISDDLHVEYPDVINDKFSDVFKKTFENMGHIEHYNMMMGIEPEKEVES